MTQNVLLMNKRLFLFVFLPLFLCITKLSAQSGFFVQDSIILKLNNCNGKAEFCFDNLNPGIVQNLQVSVNGVAVPTPYNSCASDTIYQYTVQNLDANLGPYRLDSMTIGTVKYKNVIFADAKALTDSLNKWDKQAGWVYNAQTQRITGTPSLTYSPISYTIINSGLSNNTLGINSAFTPTALKLSFDRGTHKIVASGGAPLVKDSVYLIVACSKSNIVTKDIKVDESITVCASAKDLPANRILELTTIDPLVAPVATYSKVAGDSCINVKGKAVGKDTFRFVLNGINGISDTTILYLTVNAKAGQVGKREVNQFVQEGSKITYCINTDALLPNSTDSIKSIINYCGTNSGKEVKFNITDKNKCIELEGLVAGGLDTACIVIENQSGLKDTTIIYGYVIKKCASIVKQDLIIASTDDCALEGEICIKDFKISEDSTKYKFFVDGSVYTGETALCDTEDISGISYQNLYDDESGKILPFPYSVESWGVNGQKFSNGGIVNSLQEIVDVLNKWNPAGNWQLDTINRFFRGGDKKNTYDNLYLENQVIFTQHYALFNFGTTSKGTAFYFKKGTRDLIILETATGCTDTVKTIVHCATNRVINTEIYVNQKDTLCLDLTRVPGKNVTITNNSKDGKNVKFTPSSDKKCIYFIGNKIGKDTIVAIVCDEYNICDTTYLYVEVVPRSTNHIVYDTIEVNGTGQYCVDTLFATGKITSITNISTQSGTSVKFNLDDKKYCILYTGTAVTGTDTAKVIICDANNICDTTTVYVTVTPKKVIPNAEVRDTITVGTSIVYCLPKDKFDLALTTPLTIKNLCEKTTNKDVNFTIQLTSLCSGTNNFGYALIYNGIKVGTDTACIEITNSAGKKDTLGVLVTVIPRKENVIRDTILVATSNVVCLDVKKYNLRGVIDTAYNACPTSSGKNAAITVTKTAACASGWGVKYDGVSPGVDTACVVVTDKNGNKDTIPVYITVKPFFKQPKIIYDTVFTYQTKQFCLDTAQLNLTGVIDSIWNICPNSSGEEVVFTIDKTKGCITKNGTPGIAVIYTGAEQGIDTACYVIADDLGALDTVRFIVTVIPPQPSIIIDTVEVGKTITICPDTSQLFGKIKSVVNLCPGKGGINAKFTIDTITHCVRIEGLTVGRDTACIVVCTEFDSCDSTTIVVQVIDKTVPVVIVANDDIDSTTYPKPVIIKVLSNDKFDLKDTSKIAIKIVPGKEPKHGLAIVDSVKRIVTYVPDPNNKYCGKDTFYYYIKVGTATDTARVIVTIKCEDVIDKGPFKVYNGFSPNGDDKNDTFTITGLGNYPDNELIIYNRWGNQVYRKKNYDNSWDGSWDGHPLPDGTYYYIICLPDNGTTKVESGYLEIRR